jgi:hypothetical protein
MQQPADAGVSEELLDEALEESFPASDPLSFWSGRDPRAAGGDDEARAAGEAGDDEAGEASAPGSDPVSPG